ncbi:MAG: DsrE family protein [Nitrososphaerota archaeon]|nr:DsrE family protein [Nitrososphaerota archaeon]
MKFGLVVSTNEGELAWNAFRFRLKAIENKHKVKVFLLGRGVECQEIKGSKFDVKKMMEDFVHKGGSILTCGTCLETRRKGATELCPISTMQDLVNVVAESDKVLTFG